MKSLSEVPHNRSSPWKGLLATVFILSCWIQLTSAQDAFITVVPNPPYGIVGRNVILNIQGFSGKALVYTWYRKSVDKKNEITEYIALIGRQTETNIRQKVLQNGSLFIPDLALSDTDDYVVQILDISRIDTIEARGHLAVYDRENKFLLSGRAILGIVFGGLAGVILIGGLIYFLFFRKTGRASKHYFSEKGHSASERGEETTTAGIQGSAMSAQDLASSCAFPEIPPMSPYQSLDISRVDVYERL
ncbi:uncharacterized protein LOC141491954 [Macrotis lagotis]|uniref:uncharacterized protein LOC141491954 n=1 Tax=Macrotis lagotis TaxID=92651 RepID=UPI003D682CEA